LVAADPTYEAGGVAADFIGAKVVKVPLRKDYSHDVRAMAKADPNAGLFYVCNPNNPTGTLTSRQDIEWLLANKPAGSVVMLDEAYLHLAEAATPCIDLVAQDKDLIILRTFSKLYGMAGLRLGAAFARPDLLQKVVDYGAFAVPITAIAGATASLKVKDLVPQRRKLIGERRVETMAFLEHRGYTCVPSVSNKFMVDVKRPGQQVIDALAKQNVYVGRLFPAMPNHIRVSVGLPEEMEKFRAAFVKVTA
jgi:histidinol-phosphate/aromatic aminotransferase/cobyric acid decarboxylase-like protein